jgi:phosphinothricin acetyltransferase
VQVRDASTGDAAAVQAVYAHHVRHGVGTFEEEPPDVAEITSRMGRGHWLVAEDDSSAVLGFAHHAPYHRRSAYRFTVETSVYLHPTAVGRGVGTALLGALIDHARAAGLRQMVAAVGGGEQNPASIALHERHGFVHAGTLRGVGVKFGRPLDVVFLQRLL